MKSAFIAVSCILCFAAAACGPCGAEDIPPEGIISKCWELFRQVNDEKESVEIVMSYSDGRKEEKKLIRWTRFDAANEDSVTIKFVEPPLDRGMGLLTLRHAGGEDEQWLKMPSLKKVRKVAVGEQDKYFAGTDLTNEDIRQLVGERTRDFIYVMVRKEGDESVIEAVPQGGIETGYGRRLIWVNEKFVVTKVEYYGKNEGLIKVQINSDITVAENGFWRANHVEMDNRLLKRKTQIHIEQREINKGLSEGIFSKDFLESERM